MTTKNDPEENTNTPGIDETLIDLLLSNFAPTGQQQQLELRSTLDIVEEFSPIAEVEKWKVTTALELAGFRLSYTEAGVFWQMYRIHEGEESKNSEI